MIDGYSDSFRKKRADEAHSEQGHQAGENRPEIGISARLPISASFAKITWAPGSLPTGTKEGHFRARLFLASSFWLREQQAPQI
jgi:hypothetical protein